MSKRYPKDVESFIDTQEMDFDLRCINWCVDLFVFTDQPERALMAKWSRVNYLLGVDTVYHTNVTAMLKKGGTSYGK